MAYSARGAPKWEVYICELSYESGYAVAKGNGSEQPLYGQR